MKRRSVPVALMIALSSAVLAQDIRPTWELGRDALDPALTNGQLEVIDGVVKLDGVSAFSIPKEVLGTQQDYTLDFELRLPPDFQQMPRMQGALLLVSNTDDKAGAGFSLRYCPPKYTGGSDNVVRIGVNGYDTGRIRGVAGAEFTRFTVVAKDQALMIYRDGMLWAMTGEVVPSALPLTFGEVLEDPLPHPYELRRVKVYDQAVPPTDEEPDANVMRNIAGDQYSMQRAIIKDPSLPRILVVGDSISGGYRGFITEHFRGRAYVDYWVGSGWFHWTVKEDDFPVLRGWSGVLSNGPYDVVSWNAMTLHMWTPRNPERCLIEAFPDQMARVIEHLRKTAPDTAFLWVNCTPYTKLDEDQTIVIDHERSQRLVMFNEAADKVVARYGLPSIDLYALCEQHPDKASTRDRIHWSAEASRLMADEIIREIEKHLLPLFE